MHPLWMPRGYWSLGRGASADGPRSWRRFPRLPLLLVVVSLGLLFLVPLLLLLRLEHLGDELEDILRPAREAVSEIQFELGLESAATRAFLLSGDPIFLRQHEEARLLRRETEDRLLRLTSTLEPEIRAAVGRLRERMAESDRLLDSLVRGEVPASEYRDFLLVQHRRLLSSLESASALEQRLNDEITRGRAQYDRAYKLGLVVEIPLLLLVLIAAFQVHRLGRQYQVLAVEFERIAAQQTLLHEVSRSLVESLSVREMMQEVARGAVSTTEAQGAFVERVLHGGHEWVEVVAAEGRGGPSIGTRVPFPGSLSESVIESGMPQVLTDLGSIGENMAPYLAESCRGCSGLVIPLMTDSRALGALVLLREESRPPFTLDEARQARALGNLASAALQPALLHEALAESEDRFRELAEHLEQVIWLGSPDLTTRYYVNPAFEKVWGRTVEENYEDPELSFRTIHPEDFEEAMKAVRTVREGPYDQRYRIIRPDGSVRWIRSRGYPVRDRRGKVHRVAGISEDITDAIRAEEEREELLRREKEARADADRRRDELERITESRERLLRGLGHDLKNPISAADGYLQLLERGTKDLLPEKRRLQIERARRALHRALDLLENLLEFARAEAGDLVTRPEPVDLKAIVGQVAEEYRAQAEAKGLEMRVRLPASIPSIISDGRRIGQILGNLLSNAVKYTDEGSMEVEVEVEAERVGIHVRDTGRGIAPEDQSRIFLEYFRASKDEEGAGIGLAISRLLARALGGTLMVESVLGEGSTFTLWLPREAEEAGLV